MISEELKRIIRGEEGFVSKPYFDTVGVRTIGYGHNLDAKPVPVLPSGITRMHAERILESDLLDAEEDLLRAFPWANDLDVVRRDALIAFCFQLGITKLRLFKDTLKYFRCMKYTAAANAMRQSKWARQCPNRARRLTQQVESGKYVFNED